jgi:hypothetical protein
MGAHLHSSLSLPKPSYGPSSVIPDLFSVVKQENPEKADYDSEHRAENSEPEWNVPARVGHGIGFCLGHTSGFSLVVCHSRKP